MIKVSCQICGKIFEAKPSHIKLGHCKYCSEKCFGIAQRGEGNSFFGKQHSKETRLKISKAVKGENHPLYNKHHSKEAKKKMSKAKIGKPLSEETKKKMSEVRKGEKNANWKGGKKAVLERRKSNLKHQLNNRIGRNISLSLRKGAKNRRHWCDLVGYNTEQLKKRLENTIPDGYTWQDFIESRLHIDHIIPISAFNYDKPEHLDFKYCWALENLQLLPAKENIKKYNKLSGDFQPSLKLELI